MEVVALEPRRWQKAALEAWIAAGMRGVVEVVTGGGKTVFAQLCIVEATKRYPDLCVVVVVPTLALLDQWYVCLREELGLDDSDIASWSGRGRPASLARANLMVINTARTAVPGMNCAHPIMLVVDECHRAGSPENAKALHGGFAASLGMSATPRREYDQGFEQYIAPALGDVIYSYGLNDAGQDGILAKFRLVNVEVALLPDERARYGKFNQRIARLRAGAPVLGPDAEQRLEVLLRSRARVAALATARIPVAVSLIERHRSARAMVFHEDIAAAESIRRMLYERGHSVTIYHSKLSPSVRRDNLRLYRRGVFDVLVSCRALDEGINIPETQVAVIASGSASFRQRVQRLGRVLRPAKGKERATIYTLYATKPESDRLAREAKDLVAAEDVAWMRARTGDASEGFGDA